MPEISRFYGIIVAMYYDEHNPPHFHARYGSHEVIIRIKDLARIAGSFPPRALGMLLEWAALHQEELLENWARARSDQELKPVSPLD